jgi:hypothetical protein
MGFQTTSQGSVAGTAWATSKQGTAEQKRLTQQTQQQQKNVVTVVPSQALLNWMQFNGQGGVQVQSDTNTATNTTAPSYPLPSLPGGGGS